MDSIISPVTGLPNTKVISFISTGEVVRSYYNELGVNVSRFFKDIDKIEIVKCLDTGYCFYYPFNILGDEKFYDELIIQLPKKFNVPYYCEWKWEYNIFMDYINPSDKIYEIGCGSGILLKKLNENGIKNVSGADLNPNSVNSAVKQGLKVEFLTIEEKARSSSDKYDIVCAFQVLEHICQVKSFLYACIRILKDNGKLIFSVPYNNPFLFKNDILNTLNLPPHHMGLWNEEAFHNLPNFFNLKLETIIIEKLPQEGYDFEQFYKINKDILYSNNLPFKPLFDELYYRWLKKFHLKYSGKNIFIIFRKL